MRGWAASSCDVAAHCLCALIITGDHQCLFALIITRSVLLAFYVMCKGSYLHLQLVLPGDSVGCRTMPAAMCAQLPCAL